MVRITDNVRVYMHDESWRMEFFNEGVWTKIDLRTITRWTHPNVTSSFTPHMWWCWRRNIFLFYRNICAACRRCRR